MTPGELATLSLLDTDQGVCPSGHPCRLDDGPGFRQCDNGEFVGLALICWEVTSDEIDWAEVSGANALVLEHARAFVLERDAA